MVDGYDPPFWSRVFRLTGSTRRSLQRAGRPLPLDHPPPLSVRIATSAMSGTASGQNGGGGVVMNSTSSDNTTTVVSAAGPDVIQVGDFYQKAGILHPMIIGSIAVIFLPSSG